jgi:hypothetical protein
MRRTIHGSGKAGEAMAASSEQALRQLATKQRERGRAAVLSGSMALLLCSERNDGQLAPRSSATPSTRLQKARARALALAQHCIGAAPADPSCLGLLQQLAMRCPDRAAYRSLVATAVVELSLPLDDRSAWFEFAQRLACHRSPKRRLVALDIVGELIRQALAREDTYVRCCCSVFYARLVWLLLFFFTVALLL